MASRRNPQERLAAGNALAVSGRHAEAAQIFRSLTREYPNLAELHFNLGNALKGSADLPGAERAYEKALSLKPDLAAARYNLANLRRDLKRNAQALDGYAAVLAAEPGHVGALTNAAALLVETDGAAAVPLLHRALVIEPDHDAAMNQLGLIARELGDARAAEHWFRRATALQPGRAAAWSNLGDLLRTLGRFAEAAFCHRTALALDPANPELLTNLGIVLYACQQLRAAEACHRRALALRDAFAPAQWNLSLVSLALGNLADGWSLYESRFAAGATPARSFDIPRWQGDALDGRRLLIWREQGIGDELLWSSCLPDVVAAGACVIECEPRLVSLFARTFPDATVRAESTQIRPADADCQLPIASLPRLFRPQVGAFPDRPALLADPQRVAFWRARLDALGPELKIGLSWRSMRGRRAGQLADTYTELADWRPLFDLSGVRIVSLQYDDDPDERGDFPMALWPDLDLRNDFEGLAALITALDGTVSVANTVAALAGALGARAVQLVLAGDWIRLGTQRLPWFSTTTPFAREAGEADWAGPVGCAVDQVRRWRDARRQGP